ncbi:MAG: NAD-dependent epimerase/dehydratase family protein [Chitinophagaceae bacterium]
MVIGNGLLAKRFYKYSEDKNPIIFASGVSNSTNRLDSEFQREENLLKYTIEKNTDKRLIYFSTCSVYDPALQDSPYVLHKLAMEALIKANQPHYHIFRISNLAGKTNNPHTILNYFAQHVISGSFFHLWKESYRNIIDIDDAFSVCDYIIENNLFLNEVVNIANHQNYRVDQIVSVLEEHIGKKANYDIVHKNSNPKIDVSPTKDIVARLNITFDDSYLQRIIEKYFPVK